MPGPSAHSFDELARAHGAGLLGFAMRLSRDPTEAADLVQDAFERALRRIDDLPTVANPRAWLFTILHNAFIDRCRAQMAAPRTECVETEDPPVSEKLPPTLSMTITGDQLRRAIEQLEPEFRVVYVKHAIERHSYQALSTELGLPVNTIGTRLSRARQKLQVILVAMVGAEGGAHE